MGTNYYMRYNKCKCCDRFDSVHIGKSSMGWQFSFQAIEPELPYGSPEGSLPVSDPKEIIVCSWKDWQEILQREDNSIHDEYERVITYLFLKKLIDDKKENKSNKNHTVECLKDYIYQDKPFLDSEGHSFLRGDFS